VGGLCFPEYVIYRGEQVRNTLYEKIYYRTEYGTGTVNTVSDVVHPWTAGNALILLDKEGWGRGANCSTGTLASHCNYESKFLALVEAHG
jgi:hypothetical protein